MKLAELLDEERVFLDLRSQNCGELMDELVHYFVDLGIIHNEMCDQAVQALKCREEEISTGVGCGVAIPHAYLEGLEQAQAIFGRSEKGIDFASCDHAPVHFVVLLLIPEAKRGQHLLTLADIGKRFSSCEVRKSLAGATSKESILEVLAN